MVSRKRAAEAVRAGPLATKGRLLFFLDEISDQELAGWDLQDTDEDGTIRDFLLDRAQALFRAMDPAQQRQAMCDALSSLGFGMDAVSTFDDDTLDKLLVAKFHLPGRLQSATREDLKVAGVAPGDVCYIMSQVRASKESFAKFRHEEVAAAFNAAVKALGVDGKELGALLGCLAGLSEKELAFFPIGADSEAVIEFVRTRSKGAAAGLVVESTTGAAAATGLGAGSAAGAGVAAGPSSCSTANVGLMELLFPSRLYIFTFTLYNGSRVVTSVVSHAKALRFRGEVRHLSGTRTNFMLLLSAVGESNEQTLLSFARWLTAQVPVREYTAEAEAVGTSAAEEEGPLALVTSDLSNPVTSDQAMLNMYHGGPLSVSSTRTVQLALEEAARVAEQEERLSQFSLGKSSASSAQE